MGIGAAVIFPATLAIISNVFTDGRERAKAIGIWSAVAGAASLPGPIAGGWPARALLVGLDLLDQRAVVASRSSRLKVLARNPRIATRPARLGGLALSIASITHARVHHHRRHPSTDGSSPNVHRFAVAAVAGLAFVAGSSESSTRCSTVAHLRQPRFSAASASVTSAFFALFGFVFPITQYFQFVPRLQHRWKPACGRCPFAFTGFAAPVPSQMVHRVGTKFVVAAGLATMASGSWVVTASAATPYLDIVGQMILLGAGLGLIIAPATESIMGSLPSTKQASAPPSTTPPASSAARSASPSSAPCSPPSTSPSSVQEPSSTPCPPTHDRSPRTPSRPPDSSPRSSAARQEDSSPR